MPIKPPALLIDPYEQYRAVFQLSTGTAVFNLFSKEVTNIVNSFVFLASSGYYDRTTFHRVITDLLLQGGDPDGTGEGGPGYYIADQFAGHRHRAGTLSMANCGPNTNGSQFFVTLTDAPWLDDKYSIIGEVVDGMQILGSIRQGDPLLKVTIQAGRPTRQVSWEQIVERWEAIMKEQAKKGEQANNDQRTSER
jgi:peptidyl-prolyl cis-trans isomerase B (cyclophilin B)